MKFESFSLRIEPSAGGSYAVFVQSPQGEGQTTFQLPRTVEPPPWTGTQSGIDRAGEVRDLATPRPILKAPALDTGKDLFRELFRDEVANLFHASLGSLRRKQQGLRINIAIDPRRA